MVEPGPVDDVVPSSCYQTPPVAVPVNTAPAPGVITAQPLYVNDIALAPVKMEVIPLNVPAGLEFLSSADYLFVKQHVDMWETCCSCERENKYKIKNSAGTTIYGAKEDTGCCNRNCCGRRRAFDIKINDANSREVIHLSRPFACNTCWCPCLLQSLDVYAPPEELAGRIIQEWTLWSSSLRVVNPDGETVFRIKGPCCTSSICGCAVEFKIYSEDGTTEVGKISKNWSGLLKETFTDADTFGISFPMDLEVRMKAVLLGAVILLDFMYFEKSGRK